jgi:hypothetical protein
MTMIGVGCDGLDGLHRRGDGKESTRGLPGASGLRKLKAHEGSPKPG